MGSLSGFYVKITDATNNPSIGASYNSDHNKFINKKLYDSWVLNETTFIYEAPVEMPSEGEYYWNEEDEEWVEVVSGITE